MLAVLHREIDSRTGEIAASRPDWPCRKGCDNCCRRLAEPPRLTRAEWELLEDGLKRLSQDTRSGIEKRLREPPGRVCPFLEAATGSCLVYDFRPVACRTYGFYMERDKGLYCKQIEDDVAAGKMDGVVWGNAAGIEARMSQLGERIRLNDWFSTGCSQEKR